MRHLLLVPVGLLLSGCPGLAKDVPRPPTWDDQCKPSDPFYWDLANSMEDMAPDDLIPTDPSQALKVAEAEIAEAGITIEPKAEGLEDWEFFNDTATTEIYTDKKFDSYNDAGKAGILWHELVHVREYERHEIQTFFVMYAFPEGRWALEVQAYRESYRVLRLWGMAEEEIKKRMRPRAEMLYDGYDLFQMPKECAIQGAIDIWMQDSP
jgi:hypothetical protein